jgi:hypothetical protein
MLVCVVFVSSILAGCSSTSDPSGPQDDGPDASIAYPPDNSVIGSTVEVAVSVTDNRSVACVDFYVDDALALSDSTSPYAYTWDAVCTPLASAHQIRAIAYDEAGDSGAPDSITVHSRWRTIIEDDDETRYCNLKRVCLRSTETLIEFRVEMYEGWVDPYAAWGALDCGLFLDTDCDTLTGLSEASGFGYAPNDIGADYLALVGWEGTQVAVWNDSTYWSGSASYDYLNLTDNSDCFEAGIALGDISWPSAIDIVAANLSDAWDWAPDTGHASYEITADFIPGVTTSRIRESAPSPVPNDGRPMPLTRWRTE